MAKSKVTITVDKERVTEAIRLTGAASSSAAIDLALRALIKNARAAHDVTAYLAHPQTPSEQALSTRTPNRSDLDDDVDWEAEFAPVSSHAVSSTTTEA
jgi:Arc/MetJ family transcription regulator